MNIETLIAHKKDDDKTLYDVVKRLLNEGVIEEKERMGLNFQSSAYDFYKANPLLQEIPSYLLNDSLSLISYLLENREKIRIHKGKESLSLGYMVTSLCMGGKIDEKKLKGLRVDASAADYYHNNVLLQEIPPVMLKDSFLVLEYLRTYRSEMTSPEGKDHNSMQYLINALAMGGKITRQEQKGMMLDMGAAEYYEKNTLLHSISQEILSDSFRLVTYLKENRDKMTKPSGQDHNSLGYLARALVMGGKIPKSKQTSLTMAFGAAEYALEKRSMIEEELIRVYCELPNTIGHPQIMKGIIRDKLDREKFTWLLDDKKIVSENYFCKIFDYAMAFYGDELIWGKNESGSA